MELDQYFNSILELDLDKWLHSCKAIAWISGPSLAYFASVCSTKGNYVELEDAPPTMPTVSF